MTEVNHILYQKNIIINDIKIVQEELVIIEYFRNMKCYINTK